MQSHVIHWIIIGLDLFPDDMRSFSLKLNYFVSFLHVLSDLFRICKSVNILQEHWSILGDILWTFGVTYVPSNVLIVIWRIKLKSLAESLIVSAVPIMEASIPQFVFFFAFFFGKLNMFNALKITGILCFQFFFKKFL